MSKVAERVVAEFGALPARSQDAVAAEIGVARMFPWEISNAELAEDERFLELYMTQYVCLGHRAAESLVQCAYGLCSAEDQLLPATDRDLAAVCAMFEALPSHRQESARPAFDRARQAVK